MSATRARGLRNSPSGAPGWLGIVSLGLSALAVLSENVLVEEVEYSDDVQDGQPDIFGVDIESQEVLQAAGDSHGCVLFRFLFCVQ